MYYTHIRKSAAGSQRLQCHHNFPEVQPTRGHGHDADNGYSEAFHLLTDYNAHTERIHPQLILLLFQRTLDCFFLSYPVRFDNREDGNGMYWYSTHTSRHRLA